MKALLNKLDWRTLLAAALRYAATFIAGGQILN
jgi:hypothetical protein